MRRTVEDAVNHAWLEKVASEMLADTGRPDTHPPTPPAVRCAMDEGRPTRRRRRAQQRNAKPRDGYGRPLRSAPVPPPLPAPQNGGRETPRTGHPLGITGKVLLGAALTSVGMGLTPGLAAAEPVQDNNTTTSTSNSRPAPAADVRTMTDRQLGQELGRVSGKDPLRTQEVVTEMKLRGTQILEAAPPANGVGVTGPLRYDRGNGGVLTNATPQQVTAPPSESVKPTLKIVVVGDSFTSGEGADSSTYRTVQVPVTTHDGITYQTYQIDPAHQSSTAPTLQAINQIQAANPGANLQVSFVPVSGATRDSLYQTTNPGTPFEQPPQINAVKGADIVIVGIGGNDARFSDWVKTALFNTDSSSAEQFPQFMQQLNDGTYLANQTKLLNDISGLAAPNATIVSLGYPKALPATVPGTPTWWSPFSWSTISQGEADRSNQLATALNTNNQDASGIAASQHPQQQWLYADVSTALQGRELLTNQEGLNGLTPSNVQGSYHPNDLGQQLLGSVLQPYVEQAVNGQLARWGVQGAENVPPINPTFAYQWNLRVDVPLQMQAQPPNQPPADQTQPPAQDSPAAPAPSGQPVTEGTNQPDGTDQTTPAPPEAAQFDGAQPGTPQPGAPGANQPEGAPDPVVVPDPAAGTDPNADPDGDGIPTGQDPTWNENNTDPTSTDVGDGPEGNPGYTSSTETESGYSDSGFGNDTANADTGSGNFSGTLDTGSPTVSGNPDISSGSSDTGSSYSDTSPSFSDTGSSHSDTGPSFSDTGTGSSDTGAAYSDSGFGANSGANSGGLDSGSSGSFDSGSSGSFDSGSSSGFDSGGFGGDAGF